MLVRVRQTVVKSFLRKSVNSFCKYQILNRNFNDYRRVVVTGIGIVCPIGVGKDRVWTNLLDGKCGITKVVGDGYETIPSKIAAYVPTEELLLDQSFTKNELRTLPMATIYALLATEEALNDSNWKPTEQQDQRETGVAVGMGMIDMNEVIQNGLGLKNDGFHRVSPHFVTKLLVNMPAGHISIKYHLRGPNHSVSTACTTGAHSLGDAFSFIQRGSANVMVCGGTESVICPLSMAAFSRIRALCSKYNDNPSEASRPFDTNRCGFVMGEGAGIVVLEELNHAINRKAKIYAELRGYGLSGDANHMTAPGEDGNGAIECMRAAVKDAKLNLDDITHINCHATSTPLGDKIELKAIKQLFGEHSNNIMITSTKGSTGHLLGAAGSVEAIFTILSCYHSIVPPTINLDEPLDKHMNIVSKTGQKWNSSKRIAITNSFGFGGTNASLVISNFLL